MPSHTISVHFRCPLLLFLLSFSCPICPHLSTLIFGCLHPDMPPRSMPQPVPRRPPSQSDTAHRCSLLPQKRREDSFSSHGQPRYSCHPFPAQTANFRGLCCFSHSVPMTRCWGHPTCPCSAMSGFGTRSAERAFSMQTGLH